MKIWTRWAMVATAALMTASVVAAPADSAAAVSATAGSARAEQAPDCVGIGTIPEHVTGGRIRHMRVDGQPVSVLLPPGYGKSNRRYPVLYLLHGGSDSVDHFLKATKLRSVMGQLPAKQQYIVVTPSGGYAGFYLNWRDKSHSFETNHIKRVIPAVDRRFRTKANRRNRAVAGASMGGFGAMHYALTYPKLFSAVGTFSGSLDIQQPDSTATILAATNAQRHCVDGKAAGSYDPYGLLGDPVADAASWRAANPAANARKARPLDVYLSDTAGVPCNATDAQDPTAAFIEGVTHRGTASMDAALSAARIQHTYRSASCGVHTTPHFNKQIVAYLKHLGRLFGSRQRGR